MRIRIVSIVAALLALAGVSTAVAEPPQEAAAVTTLAVIGDTPYGAAQVESFHELIAAINADPDVERVVHVGDIKNGSTRCDTSYFTFIEESFATFADPLVYTPGDNEWTDCHRSNNGKYDPLERLATLRSIFFAEPGSTLGGSAEPLLTQAYVPGFADIPENVAWKSSRVLLATLHVVGSRNGRAPWFGDDTTDALVDDEPRRVAEVEHRTAAAIDWLERVFAMASKVRAPGVVLFMQADTWPGSATDGFGEIIRRLSDLSRAFGQPVLVVQGDSHRYLVDQPLANGDAVHGVETPVPNLTRIVVEGETSAEWLKLRIDPRPSAGELFSWERVHR